MNYSEHLIKFECPLAQKKDILETNYNIKTTEKEVLSFVLSDILNEMSVFEKYLNNLEDILNKNESTINFKINNGISYNVHGEQFYGDCRDLLNEIDSTNKKLEVIRGRHKLYKDIESNFDHYLNLSHLINIGEIPKTHAIAYKSK